MFLFLQTHGVRIVTKTAAWWCKLVSVAMTTTRLYVVAPAMARVIPTTTDTGDSHSGHDYSVILNTLHRMLYFCMFYLVLLSLSLEKVLILRAFQVGHRLNRNTQIKSQVMESGS